MQQLFQLSCDNFISKMSSPDKIRKNQSMNSTHYMSGNQSYSTNFYHEAKGNRSVMLSYAHIPMRKEPARWNQSAATWRNTSHKYSFSKDDRFKESSFYYTDIIEPQIPTSITSKSCTFGKGNKKPISTVILRNAKEKPAPDRYDITCVNETTRQPEKGKTFGLGWNAYERTYLKQRNNVYSAFQNQDNPPAKYQIRETPGQNKRQFTAYGRLKMYTQKLADSKSWVPGPHHNVKDRHLYGTVGMNDRNFAFGERIDLAKPANDYPEAIYNLPNFCDKFENIRHKSEKPSCLTAR